MTERKKSTPRSAPTNRQDDSFSEKLQKMKRRGAKENAKEITNSYVSAAQTARRAIGGMLFVAFVIYLIVRAVAA
ncbi:hypothetical protein LJC27_07810 [Christensenellaceae bacterium OttesenSCG-928-M15]|nr:hypothetical protein [Christensenellaceae bacterium OttesenSCG-928-M15]